MSNIPASEKLAQPVTVRFTSAEKVRMRQIASTLGWDVSKVVRESSRRSLDSLEREAKAVLEARRFS